MGATLSALYDIENIKATEGGPYLKWKLIPAKHTARGNEPVTIFVFEKAMWDTYNISAAMRESILEFLKKDAACLLKLRHPNILSILEPLSEDRSTLAFVTKPVEGTLKHLLQNRGKSFTALEVKCGIMEILEALVFLHNDVKLAHLAINLETIFIAQDGKWLLGGLGSSISLTSKQTHHYAYPLLRDTMATDIPSSLVSVLPPLDYSPPEYSSDSKAPFGAASDIFSLGVVIYEVLSTVSNDKLLKCNSYDYNSHQRVGVAVYPHIVGRTAYASAPYQCYMAMAKCRSIFPLKHSTSKELISLLNHMLNLHAEARPTAQQLLDYRFFQDMNIQALRFLERLHDKEESQRIVFLERFKTIMNESSELMNPTILRQRVLPALLNCLLFLALYPTALANIFVVLHHLNDPEMFMSLVWPSMLPLFSSSQIQIESVIKLLSELKLLLELSDENVHRKHLFPFVVRCIKVKELSIQEAALKSVFFLSQKADYVFLRNSILPHVTKLISATDSVKLRTRGIDALLFIAEAFDRSTIVEHIIATIEKVLAKDCSRTTCMCACNALGKLSQQLGHKASAQHILPVLCPLLVNEDLETADYEALAAVVKSVLDSIQEYRNKISRTAVVNKEVINKVLGETANGETLDFMFSQPKSSHWSELSASSEPEKGRVDNTANFVPSSMFSSIPLHANASETNFVRKPVPLLSPSAITQSSHLQPVSQSSFLLPPLSSLIVQPLSAEESSKNKEQEKDPFDSLDVFSAV